MYLTIVEMAKAYDLNLYEYLKFLLERRTNENISDEELEHLAPWSIDVQEQCRIN
nr:transposase domain-containing protein [uncultured Sellimonas sp.]